MDATHIHLVLTHFPIIGVMIGAGIFAIGLFLRNQPFKLLALGIFFTMALVTIPVYLTGESAEETVESLPGVSEDIIESHEDLAGKAIWLMGALGILSLFGIVAISMKIPFFTKTMSIITLLMALTTFGLFAKVGNMGGQIRHTEIRPAQSQYPGENPEKASPSYIKDDDHD